MARTIADLAESEKIQSAHLGGAAILSEVDAQHDVMGRGNNCKIP